MPTEYREILSSDQGAAMQIGDDLYLGHGEGDSGGYFFWCDHLAQEFVIYRPAHLDCHRVAPISEGLRTGGSRTLSLSEGQTREDFGRIKSVISQGQLAKMVLFSRSSSFDWDDRSFHHAFQRAIGFSDGEVFSYWANGRGQIGASPERLMHWQDGVLETMALASTGALSDLQSSKNVVEHEHVIQDIAGVLTGLGAEVSIQQTSRTPFGDFFHLHTPIRARGIERVMPQEIVQLLAPTAALGGYPRVGLKEQFQQSQWYQKFGPLHWYGGCMGLVMPDFTHVKVMIRSVLFEQHRAWIDVGAGVVRDSQEESEVGELRTKLQMVAKVLLG